MFDLSDITKLADSLYKTSWELNKRWGKENPEFEYEIDKRNELQCIALYDDGWRSDGFDYVDNSNDIITFWKKDGEDERREVRLTMRQQRRWIRRIQQRIKEDKRRARDDQDKKR